jgi:site-specific recombinase XerD
VDLTEEDARDTASGRVTPIGAGSGRPGRGPQITLTTAFEQFIRSREIDARTARTLHGYQGVLAALAEWLARERGVTDAWALTRDDIETWLLWLRQTRSEATGKRRSAHTIQSYATHALAALRWLETRGVIPALTTAGLHKPGIPVNERKRPQTLTDAEVEALFAACAWDGQGEGEQHALAARNRALLSMLLDTGVRVSEAASMRVEAINWERRSAEVLESKTRLRAVAFGDGRTTDLLRRYALRGPRHALCYALDGSALDPDITDATGALWLGRDGYPLTAVGVEKLLARLRARAAVTSQCSPHTCRRYYITRSLQLGAPPTEIAAQCGVSLAVIMRHYYAATEGERLERVRAGSPMDRLEQARREAQRGGASGGRRRREGDILGD